MKRLVKKLRSNGGASLIFAMVVFALCVLAGVVVLTSSAANVGRYTHLEAEQQQYLSVASALELLQAQMNREENAVTVEVKYTKTESWYYEEDTTTGVMVRHDDPPTYELKLTDPADAAKLTFYQKLMLINCVPDEWYTNAASGSLADEPEKPTNTVTKNYTVKLADESTPGADYLYQVAVNVTEGIKKDDPAASLDTSDYSLTMTLKAQRETEGAPDTVEYYPIQVIWPGEVTTKTESSIVTESDGDKDRDGNIDSGKTTTTTTLTCTLTWSEEDRVIAFLAEDD